MKVIASIYPLPLRAKREFFSVSSFALDAAKPGEVVYCTVPDGIYESEYVGNERYVKKYENTTAELVAADLVNEWTRNYPFKSDDQCGPGVMVIAGTVATPEEIEAMTKRQTPFAMAAIADADDHQKQGLAVQRIRPIHHVLAQWFGAEPEEHQWMKFGDTRPRVECPMCGTKNLATVAFCQKCETQLISDEELNLRKAKLKKMGIKKAHAEEPVTVAVR